MSKNDATVPQFQDDVAAYCETMGVPAGSNIAPYADLASTHWSSLQETIFSGWGLVGIAVWMIYTGRLVPKRFYEHALAGAHSKGRRNGRRRGKGG